MGDFICFFYLLTLTKYDAKNSGKENSPDASILICYKMAMTKIS